MTCRKSFELDLAAFLAHPGDAEWDEFRTHYPRCLDCAAEVAAWTALGARLGPEHPAPETLLRFADDSGSMAAEERDRTARHVERCPTCQEELRALGGFAASATAALAPAARSEELGPGEATVDRSGFRRPARAPVGQVRRPSRLRRVGRALWNPALPYAALLALVLLPRLWPTIRERAPTTGPVASFQVPSDAGGKPRSAEPNVPKRSLSSREEAAPPMPAPAQEERTEDDARLVTSPSRAKAAADAPERSFAGAESAAAPASPPAAQRFEPSAGALAAPPSEPLAKTKVAAPGSHSPDEASLAGGPSQAPAKARFAAPGAAGLVAERSAAPLDLRWTAASGELVVVLPERVRRAGIVDVRVRDATGDRELKERIALSPSQTELRLDLPSSWSASPRVVVELHAEAVGLVASGTIATR